MFLGDLAFFAFVLFYRVRTSVLFLVLVITAATDNENIS